jgi:ParB family chromosome partitioning protein
LIQRSFTDLSHSERAEALATHYSAIKHQGKRTDLIKQVEALISGDMADISDSVACTPAGNKSIEATGEKYGLSKNSVARYIRVNSLIAEFKELLDSEEISLRAGVSLSYMDEARQQTILNQMQRYDVGINMKQAEQLKQLNAETSSDAEDGGEKFLLGCADVLSGRNALEKESKPAKTINFKLERTAVESYFEEADSDEVIQEKVLAALDFYHKFRDKYADFQSQ